MADADTDPAAPEAPQDEAAPDQATQDETVDGPTDPVDADDTDTDTDQSEATQDKATQVDDAEDKAAQDDAGSADENDTTKTFSIDTDSPETGITKKYPIEGGTTPSWWAWVRRHPKPVLWVTGLLVVGLVATLVIVSMVTPGPKDVVQEYLDAIRAGDTEAAIAIAGEPEPEGRQPFLTEKALADDWTVDSVVERYQDDDDAEVDVTFSAGDVSRQGRFSLVHGEDGWKIEEPYVRVDLMAGGMSDVELGGEQHSIANTTTAQNGLAQLLLFPGVYKLYPSLAKRATFDPSVLIAAPQASEGAVLRVSATRTLTDAAKDEIEKAVNKHIDGCAEKTSLSPSDCPFGAEDSAVLYDFDDVDNLVWKVVSYPEPHFGTGTNSTIAINVRKPGTLALTGTATPEEPEGAAPVNFAVTCEFGFNGIGIDMTMDGFTVNGDARDIYTEQMRTMCF